MDSLRDRGNDDKRTERWGSFAHQASGGRVWISGEWRSNGKPVEREGFAAPAAAVARSARHPALATF